MEEHNNTDISDKRKPTSDEQQTIYDKRKRRAEYDRQYRARKKALLVSLYTELVIDVFYIFNSTVVD